MRWTPRNLTLIEVVTGLSEGDILTVRIGTPAGEVMIMARVDIRGRTLALDRVHIQSTGGPRSIGLTNLRAIAEFALERMDCDEARIEGAARTTGANPGRTPNPLRFIRRPCAVPS